MKATIKHKVVIENDWTDRISTVLEMEKIPAGSDVSYFYNDVLNETVVIAKYEKEVKYYE